MSSLKNAGEPKAVWLTEWAMRRPRAVFIALSLVVLASLALFSRLEVDTDPENMLPVDQADRVFHQLTKRHFDLRDAIVVGLVAEGEHGVYTPQSLGRLHELTRAIASIEGVVEKDLISLATLDKIEPGSAGSVRFSWLMKEAPQSPEQARAIRAAVERIPMLLGSAVSEDGRAAAIAVPLEDKHHSHRIAQEIKDIIANFSGPERYFITGLPVAEDTFGVEMFVQMGISAPLAALVIVIMMWLFFRSGALIASPMLLAMASVIVTMGALIGSGFSVHIMSSMIPIFLMPIAVVDSVHVLSEFKDTLPEARDVRCAVRRVMRRLFPALLFTSLTSAAGFASLALTPIPPVRVFGAFVAFGIALAFLLTLTVLPAYIVSLQPERLEALLRADTPRVAGATSRGMALLRRVVGQRKVAIIATATLGVLIAAVGIGRLTINDNPIRWFAGDHEIRVADRVLNQHFSGTYRSYLVLEAPGEIALGEGVERRVAPILSKASADVSALWRRAYADFSAAPEDSARLGRLIETIAAALEKAHAGDYPVLERLLTQLEHVEVSSRVFHSPEVLRSMEGLQRSLDNSDLVGKTTSLVDVVKTVHRDLRDGSEAEYRVPDTARAVGQVLLSYQSSHRPDDLFHFVTPDSRRAVIWVQQKSGDNVDVSAVQAAVESYLVRHPLPRGVTVRWAGLPHINVVWQEQMVRGMGQALMGSFVMVLLMMLVLFRSLRFALVAMLPLALTILFIYGALGILGKDYDMPVAVLSSLALGLSIDFAIHFVARARQIQAETGCLQTTLDKLFEEPARAIVRNAVVIAVGFLPLLAAPLVPYVTVGLLMAAIMALSALSTLLLLPVLLHVLPGFRLPERAAAQPIHQPSNQVAAVLRATRSGEG